MTGAIEAVSARRGPGRVGSLGAVVRCGGVRVGLLAATLVLAGCSWPSLGGLWGGEEEVVDDPTVARAESTEAADDVPGQDAPYPNLATVPDRSTLRRSGRLERAKLAEGLVADRENARYSDQVVRRDSAFARAPQATPRRSESAPSREPRTTAVLGAPAAPASPAPPSPPPATVTPAKRASGGVAGASSGGSATKAPTAPAPAVPAAPVQAVPIASAPSVSSGGAATKAAPAPAPAAPVQAATIASAPPARSEAMLIGKPAILPPPLPPPQPSPPSPPTTGSVARSGTSTAPPPSALTAPPPPPPMLASPAPSASRRATAATPSVPPAPALAQAPPAPRPAEPASAPYRPELAGRSDQVGTILFQHGSARLAAEDRRLLRQIANLHRTHGGTVRIVGHSSSRTRETNAVRHQMINFEISLKRANAVAAVLRRLGVPADSIVVEAKSNSEPKFYEWMPSGEAGNRRADVFLDY